MTNPPTRSPIRCLSRAVNPASHLLDAVGVRVNRQLTRYSSMALRTYDKIYYTTFDDSLCYRRHSDIERAAVCESGRNFLQNRTTGETYLKLNLFVGSTSHQLSLGYLKISNAVMA